MIITTLRSSFTIQRYINPGLLKQLQFSFIDTIMNDTITNARQLFKRLRDAKTQAEALKMEIKDIGLQIQVLSECEIFQKYLDGASFSEFKSASDGETEEPPKKRGRFDFQMDGGYVVAYTDGACENNGKSNAKAGIGVWFDDNHPLNISQPVKGKATNNVAEIQACIEAVKVAKEQGIENLKLITDSQFTINCMTKWIQKWKKNNWRLAGGGDVKNQSELVELDKLVSTIKVKWEHVAGHRGIKGNEEADKLARAGALRYRPR